MLTALPRALPVLTDPAECGPVTLALCQDAQAEAFDWPEAFFAPRVWQPRRPPPDARELAAAAAAAARRASPADHRRRRRALRRRDRGRSHASPTAHGIPVAETQAGKGALPDDHPLNLGAIGVTGTAAANRAAAAADVVLAVGTRLQDFTTGSRALFSRPD